MSRRVPPRTTIYGLLSAIIHFRFNRLVVKRLLKQENGIIIF
ncbi:CRISPR-associated protein Cas5 [Neobacillus cucumis]